jgi:hypothetical protein
MNTYKHGFDGKNTGGKKVRIEERERNKCEMRSAERGIDNGIQWPQDGFRWLDAFTPLEAIHGQLHPTPPISYPPAA